MPPTAPQFDVEREVSQFLASCRTASLATVDEHGQPHAANVQFAHDDRLRLYWVSSPDSAHSVHVARTGRVALTVYAHDDRVNQLHGVQFRGRVEIIDDPSAWHEAFELYTGKFTFAAALPQVRERIEQERFYRFTPTWLRWIDNRRSFGFKVERDLSAGG